MRHLTLIVLFFMSSSASANAVGLNDLRIWTAPERTRLVFDLEGQVEHTIFTLPRPNRVVIDLKKVRLAHTIQQVKRNETYIKKIRHGVQPKQKLRIVLDLKKKVRVQSFFLPPNNNYGHRLVVDIRERTAGKIHSRIHHTEAVLKRRDVLIAIDAGHGGEDPGAIGKKGTEEKDVVLAIAKKLKKIIDQERGMRAILVRSGDYYIELRDRMAVARKHVADLFISIHADAFRKASVQGSSVFVLSEKGASSEAAHWLAQRENGADMIGGVNLSRKDDMLAKILMDLSQTATNEISRDIASNVVSGMKNVGKMHKKGVQYAGFQVLKSPDIPSILVETAFITNSIEERKLKDVKHQGKIARAIFNGVKRYYQKNPPIDSYFAMRKHTVTRGDTLGGIAQYYGVGVRRLRKVNRLKTDLLLVGRELFIPFDS